MVGSRRGGGGATRKGGEERRAEAEASHHLNGATFVFSVVVKIQEPF